MSTAAAFAAEPDTDTGATIRDLAQEAGILFGSGSVKASNSTTDDRPANYFSDPRYGQVLAEQFNSLSPENEFKWNMVQPEEGIFDFEGLDRLVAFAEEHGMEAKAHAGISRSFNPDYLVAGGVPPGHRGSLHDHHAAIHGPDGPLGRGD